MSVYTSASLHIFMYCSNLSISVYLSSIIQSPWCPLPTVQYSSPQPVASLVLVFLLALNSWMRTDCRGWWWVSPGISQGHTVSLLWIVQHVQFLCTLLHISFRNKPRYYSILVSFPPNRSIYPGQIKSKHNSLKPNPSISLKPDQTIASLSDQTK